MYYLICFIVTVISLIWLINNGYSKKTTILVFGMAMSVGNGGYCALSASRNLEEALLANKLCYVVGMFVPMLLFLIMCEVCRVKIKNLILTIMTIIQITLYMSVCSIGRLKIFYTSAEIHIGRLGTYLTRSYGPMHTVYAVSLIIYMILSLIVAVRSLSKKNIVNVNYIELMLAVNTVTCVMYLIERFINLDIELLPIMFTIGFILNIIPLYNIQKYSLESNTAFIQERFITSAYIVFDMKLRYRGCNEYARELFPELESWALDRKIPGNGGRFNTYLRQPLLKFIRDENNTPKMVERFTIKDESYVQITRNLISDKGRKIGYILEIRNITEYQ